MRISEMVLTEQERADLELVREHNALVLFDQDGELITVGNNDHLFDYDNNLLLLNQLMNYYGNSDDLSNVLGFNNKNELKDALDYCFEKYTLEGINYELGEILINAFGGAWGEDIES